MRISTSRSLRINLPHYERFEFGGTATVDHLDLGYTDEEWQAAMASEEHEKYEQELLDLRNKVLDQVQRADLAWARRHCQEDSVMYSDRDFGSGR